MSVTFAVTVFVYLVMGYFVLWKTVQMAMGVPALRYVLSYRRRRTRRSLATAVRLSSPPLVSIIVPAHNEGHTVADAVQSLLAQNYQASEIVVVNDGSSDDTLAKLQRTFQLVAAPIAIDQPLPAAGVRALYRSVDELNLVVVDKHAGGSKSDAVNAGINAASGRLILVIEADSLLEPDALAQAVMPFLEDPTTVAVGAYVGIANGARVEAGRVADVAMPRSWLARFQIVEYMRRFLLFRLACAAQNGVVLISGAFGLFRRDAVIAVGGFDKTAIGEDMDLTVRMQRFYRGRGQSVRIAFVPVPLCWTQAPEDFASLSAQRRRWRRGLLQVLWRHRQAIGNPRLGFVGLVALPFILMFEGFGPLIEVAGYVTATIAVFTGALSWHNYAMLVVVWWSFGFATTMLAVFLCDLGTQRYEQTRDLATLLVAGGLEHLGYHQLNAWWGFVGTIEALTGTGGWGTMKRRAFSPGAGDGRRSG